MTFGNDHFFSGGSWPLADGRLLTADCKHDQKFREPDGYPSALGCFIVVR